MNKGDWAYIKLQSDVYAMTRRLANPTVMLPAPVNQKQKKEKKNSESSNKMEEILYPVDF